MAAAYVASAAAGTILFPRNYVSSRQRSPSYSASILPPQSRRRSKAIQAKRKNDSDDDESSSPLPKLPANIPIVNLAARSAAVLFAFGFVDAGFSGDWSRIGAISKETEELLKAASSLVVPLCVFLAFSFPNPEDKS